MRKVIRSAIVPFSASEMFALVDDIETYPEFLPWCESAVVHKRDAAMVEATLELRRGGISKSFTTRNSLRQNEAIGLSLIGGPFKHLAGGWTFQQLGDSGCKVSLELDFEFNNPVTDTLFGSFFEGSCNSLVDAFTQRAAIVYGSR
ncbi:MAG: type II toxin-antitoxin system RatA family toxin [Gammaproteobacteria bacterium]|nr:MAG: type II toxin-antitoxin system RatA family toxin [Gammaproteobacteria bacterium]